VHGGPVSITNATGIVFVLFCCAAVCFMVWVFVALSRESRKHSGQHRMRVTVKAADSELLKKIEDSVPQYLATTICMPTRAACSQAANQRAVAIAMAGGRFDWERHVSR